MKAMQILKYCLTAWFLLRISVFVKMLKDKREEFSYLVNFFPIPSNVSHGVLGYLKEMMQNRDRMFHFRLDLYKNVNHADTIMLPVPVWHPHPSLWTKDSAVVKHILKDDFDSWVKPDFFREITTDMMGKSIFILNHGTMHARENDEWSLQRKTSSKIFSKSVFTGHVYQTLIKSLNRFARRIEEKLDDDKRCLFGLKEPIFAMAFDQIGEIGLGVEFNSLMGENKANLHAFDVMIQNLHLRSAFPLWKTLGRLIPFEREMQESLETLQNLSDTVIKERKQESNDSLSRRGDILSMFLQNDPNTPSEVLKGIITSFLFAGRDSTASTLCSCFYLLITHRHYQEKLILEIMQTLRNSGESKSEHENDEFFTFDMLKEMPLLDGIVFEALRLFPPIPIDPKQASKDTTLPGGVRIKKGTVLIYDQFAMGRDEKRYSNPGKFMPERWMKDRKIQTYDAFEFPVFQAGPRMCIGRDLALFEVKFMLVELLRRFDFLPSIELTPQDAKSFENDVSLMNGEAVYQPGISLVYRNQLNAVIKRR